MRYRYIRFSRRAQHDLSGSQYNGQRIVPVKTYAHESLVANLYPENKFIGNQQTKKELA